MTKKEKKNKTNLPSYSSHMIWVKSLNNEVTKLFSDRQYLADQ